MFEGGTVLTGDIDILLQVNGGTLTEIHDRLFPLDPEATGLLDGIDDIVSTSTAVTDGGRGPFKQPPSEEMYVPNDSYAKKSGGSKAKATPKEKPASN